MDHAGQEAVARVQPALGSETPDPGLMHGDGRLHGTAGRDQQLPRSLPLESGHGRHHAEAAVHELPADGAEVDHQVPVYLAEPDHHAG